MTQPWNTSLRLTLCTAALLGCATVSAQTQSAPEVAPAVAPGPVHAPHHPAKQAHPHPRAPKHHGSGKYATPQQHEAAAVAGERKRGVGPANPQTGDELTEYQRNALRRCEVFKTDDDRRACVERVRQPQISGSVQGGGVIREYTQTVQVPQPAQPANPPVQYNGPPPVQQPQVLPPPVEPIR
ncbi:hypothetical protein [Comamonas sp. NoAH]|uniref:hypothetical protein n=1 Tax=Comamonas halotolerans TaxID=3041496 RepID=UPI0024E088BD|nr:hypothetical protein [Comamonas sp. NoAH]